MGAVPSLLQAGPWASSLVIQDVEVTLCGGLQYSLNTREEVEDAGDPEVVPDLQTLPAVTHEAGLFEGAEMAGYGRCIRPDHPGQVTHAAFTAREFFNYEQTGRVSESSQDIRPSFKFVLSVRIHTGPLYLTIWQNSQICILVKT